MYLTRAQNVYIAAGQCKDCIYDLGTGKLYHIGKDVTALISRLQTAPYAELQLTADDRRMVQTLLSAHILEERECPNLADISTLKTELRIEFAWIEVCKQCNLRCVHCYNESAPDRTEMMQMRDFMTVCERLSEYGIDRIQLIGGEPFCHPEICAMLEYAAAHFRRVEVFTNGTLLNEECCRFLQAHGIRTALSVYSYLPEMHDRVTQCAGSYAKTLRAIEELNRCGAEYRVCNIHMRGIEIGAQNTDLFTLDPERDVVRMAGRGMLSLLTPALLERKLITRDTFRLPLDRAQVIRRISGNPCFGRKIYVASDCTVYPCVMERRIAHGSLKTNTLAHILRPEIMTLNQDKTAACRACEFRYACPECRPDALTDDIYAKPYYCTYDPAAGTWNAAAQTITEILRTERRCDDCEKNGK